VKNLTILFTIGLLSVWLLGCATPGKVYDDSKVALIKKDTTTEKDLLDWFGPATTRNMSPDGSKALAWKFGAASAKSSSSGRLEVHLSPEGKVIAYSAASGKK